MRGEINRLALHERMRKQMGLSEERKTIAKYETECRYKGSVKLTPEEVQAYIQAKDKTKYLKSIGKMIK